MLHITIIDILVLAYSTTIVVLACAGKFFIVAAFAIIYVQAGELYPTPVRLEK